MSIANIGEATARDRFADKPAFKPAARHKARRNASVERIPELWRTVVETVRADGLALATNLQLERHRENCA